MTDLIENNANFGTDADGLYLKHSQAIPSDFLDTLKSERHAKDGLRAAEMLKVASVPTFVWDLWLKQGRDPANASPREIIKWLHAAGLDAFITTNKRV